MKKILSVIFVVLMLFGLVGCGSESQYAGVWKAVEYEAAGQTLTADQLGDSTLTLENDGTLKADFLGTLGTGEWTENEKGIHITSDVELDCESDGKTLTMDYSGITITFEKENADAADNSDNASVNSDKESDSSADDNAGADNSGQKETKSFKEIMEESK